MRIRGNHAVLFALLALGTQARADWRALIAKQDPARPSVVTRTSELTPRDGYALLSLPRSDMEARLPLTTPGVLENPHFNVVEGKNDEPLPLEDFDGRNVLYHLMEARAFFKGLAERT